MNCKNHLDEIISRAMAQNLEDGLSQEIDLDEEWKKFRAKYFQKKSNKSRTLIFTSISLCLLLFFNYLLFPVHVKALSIKSFSAFKTYLFGKVETAKVEYTDQSTSDKINQTLDENLLNKINTLPYKISLPLDQLNIEYRIVNLATENFGDSVTVSFDLIRDAGQTVQVQQTNVVKGFSEGVSFDNEDAEYKKIRIHGQEANLIIFKKKYVYISWIDKDIFISLYGGMPEEEMILLANNMKQIP